MAVPIAGARIAGNEAFGINQPRSEIGMVGNSAVDDRHSDTRSVPPVLQCGIGVHGRLSKLQAARDLAVWRDITDVWMRSDGFQLIRLQRHQGAVKALEPALQ